MQLAMLDNLAPFPVQTAGSFGKFASGIGNTGPMPQSPLGDFSSGTGKLAMIAGSPKSRGWWPKQSLASSSNMARARGVVSPGVPEGGAIAPSIPGEQEDNGELLQELTGLLTQESEPPDCGIELALDIGGFDTVVSSPKQADNLHGLLARNACRFVVDGRVEKIGGPAVANGHYFDVGGPLGTHDLAMRAIKEDDSLVSNRSYIKDYGAVKGPALPVVCSALQVAVAPLCLSLHPAWPQEQQLLLYAGVFLTGASKEVLHVMIPPVHAVVSADHMTLSHNPSVQQLLSLPLGVEVQLKVLGMAQDSRAQAVVADPPPWLPPTTSVSSHITISVAPGVPAKEAGYLMRDALQATALAETTPATTSPGSYQHLEECLVLVGRVGVELQDGRRFFSLKELVGAGVISCDFAQQQWYMTTHERQLAQVGLRLPDADWVLPMVTETLPAKHGGLSLEPLGSRSHRNSSSGSPMAAVTTPTTNTYLPWLAQNIAAAAASTPSAPPSAAPGTSPLRMPWGLLATPPISTPLLPLITCSTTSTPGAAGVDSFAAGGGTAGCSAGALSAGRALPMPLPFPLAVHLAPPAAITAASPALVATPFVAPPVCTPLALDSLSLGPSAIPCPAPMAAPFAAVNEGLALGAPMDDGASQCSSHGSSSSQSDELVVQRAEVRAGDYVLVAPYLSSKSGIVGGLEGWVKEHFSDEDWQTDGVMVVLEDSTIGHVLRVLKPPQLQASEPKASKPHASRHQHQQQQQPGRETPLGLTVGRGGGEADLEKTTQLWEQYAALQDRFGPAFCDAVLAAHGMDFQATVEELEGQGSAEEPAPAATASPVAPAGGGSFEDEDAALAASVREAEEREGRVRVLAVAYGVAAEAALQLVSMLPDVAAEEAVSRLASKRGDVNAAAEALLVGGEPSAVLEEAVVSRDCSASGSKGVRGMAGLMGQDPQLVVAADRLRQAFPSLDSGAATHLVKEFGGSYEAAAQYLQQDALTGGVPTEEQQLAMLAAAGELSDHQLQQDNYCYEQQQQQQQRQEQAAVVGSRGRGTSRRGSPAQGSPDRSPKNGWRGELSPMAGSMAGPGERLSPEKEAEKQAKLTEVKALRQEADKKYTARDIFIVAFQKAVAAGKVGEAQQFKGRADKALSEAKALVEAANVAAFKANNQYFTNHFTVDLHDMGLRPAMQMLITQLQGVKQMLAVSPAGMLVEIITGKGNHSKEGVGIIKRNVIDFLADKGYVYQVHPNNTGVVQVMLRSDSSATGSQGAGLPSAA